MPGSDTELTMRFWCAGGMEIFEARDGPGMLVMLGQIGIGR